MFIQAKEEDFLVDLKIKNISTKVMEIINERINIELFGMWNDISNCESPIEQMFALEINERLNWFNFGSKLEKFNCKFEVFETQEKIDKYRVDFLLIVSKNNNEYKKFVIELDGHDFHEKTKEQVQRDKEKDRFLISQGYIVVRFTGSEIYKNCSEKVDELLNIVYKECGR